MWSWLVSLSPIFSPFNVFRYITFRSFLGFLLTFFVTVILGRAFIALMKKWQFGQYVREEGPQHHKTKQGTPTMGGLLIFLGLLPALLLCVSWWDPYVVVSLALFCGFGAIGFWDDWLKVSRKNNKGLSGKLRLFLEFIVSMSLLTMLYKKGLLQTQIYVPFIKQPLMDLGIFYLFFGSLVIVSSANAVNLTDGLDGLAVVPVMVVVATLSVFAYLSGHAIIASYLQIPYVPGVGELAVVGAALLGAGLGFLWYNSYPASIFMGDVGSLSLGGIVGLMAVLTKNELLLPLLGGVFVIEALSVILQVISFKWRGKRIFKMAPLHHHFELKGVLEPKIITRFWIINIILAVMSLATLKLR